MSRCSPLKITIISHIQSSYTTTVIPHHFLLFIPHFPHQPQTFGYVSEPIFFYPSVHSGSYKLYRENWWSSALRSYLVGGVKTPRIPHVPINPKMTWISWMINWGTKMHIDALQMALKWLEHLHSFKNRTAIADGHLVHRWKAIWRSVEASPRLSVRSRWLMHLGELNETHVIVLS